jgi:hypothetical protein
MLFGKENTNSNIIYFKGTPELNNIAELKKYKLSVIDCSADHYGSHDGLLSVHEQLESQKLNFIFLTHHDQDHLVKSNYLFYPHWYYMGRSLFQKVYNNNVISIKKKYKISCLNGNPRFNRIYNYLLLKKKPYFNEIFFTFHDGPVFRHDDPVLDDNMVQEWESLKHIFPKRSNLDRTANVRIDLDVLNPAYTDSYINLVTETTVIPKLLITEKTWKPVASGQLFVVIGSQGSIDHLRSQGVDTFDDIIDHKYYDNEPNWQIRIQKVHEVLDHLISSDLNAINKITQDRRSENARKFFAGAFYTNYRNTIEDKICTNTQN